jgi:hypothetical protein
LQAKLYLKKNHCDFIASENGEEYHKAPTAYDNGLQRCISTYTHMGSSANELLAPMLHFAIVFAIGYRTFFIIIV